MKRELIKKASKLSANLLKAAAVSTSASACNFSFYQPKEPKALKEK